LRGAGGDRASRNLLERIAADQAAPAAGTPHQRRHDLLAPGGKPVGLPEYEKQHRSSLTALSGGAAVLPNPAVGVDRSRCRIPRG